MGDYTAQQHLDLFGGLPEPGEALVDPREIADAERDRRKYEVHDETIRMTDEELASLEGLEPREMLMHGSTADGSIPMPEEPAEEGPAPRCVVCGQETHKLEELGRCVRELRCREGGGDVEGDEVREERWEP